MARKEIDSERIAILRNRILDVLDGKILSTRQITDEIKTSSLHEVSEAIEGFFRVEKVNEREDVWVNTWLGVAIRKDTWEDWFCYYRIDQEDAHVEAGMLSVEVRKVSAKPIRKEVLLERLNNRRRKLSVVNLPPRVAEKIFEFVEKETTQS